MGSETETTARGPVKPDWRLRRYATIMSGVVYRWERGGFEVSASRDGVSFDGCAPVFKTAGLSVLKDIIADAHGAFLALSDDHDWNPTHIGGREVLRPSFGVANDD